MPLNLSRRTAAPAIDEFYTSIHDRMLREAARNAEIRPTAREFSNTLDRFSIKGVRNALDAGCGGTASFTLAFAERGLSKVTAIDINEANLTRARALIKRRHTKVVYFTMASVTELPFQDGTFDLAVCSGVVHHTEEPARAIQELARVVKPGGILYISVYCFADSAFEKIVRALRIVGGYLPFLLVQRLCGWSRVMNNFILDHMYVPVLWLFRADEVRSVIARSELTILEEWPSSIDPFARFPGLSSLLTGDGLLRVWLCQKH